MDDSRVCSLEESLWTGDAAHYREVIDNDCAMVLLTAPFVIAGKEAISAVADTPRWSKVLFSNKQIMRPQEGLITIAYRAEAIREGSDHYVAYCSTMMRRLKHDFWRVVQHQ